MASRGIGGHVGRGRPAVGCACRRVRCHPVARGPAEGDARPGAGRRDPSAGTPNGTLTMEAASRTAFVLTVSDRGSTGEREDTSGEGVAARLATLGFSVEREIIPDERRRIESMLLYTSAAADE